MPRKITATQTLNMNTAQPRVGPLISSPLILAGIFLLGLVLRLNCLNCYSLWYDEVASVETAQRGIDAILTYDFGWLGNQTPLHYLLVWLTAQVADPAIDGTFVRLPSVLAGALTPIFVYGLGRELFGKAQGLLAALMVALSMTFLDYSQDLRPYAMMTLLTCLCVYCLLVAARTRDLRWWVAFTLAAIANMYNSYVAVTMVLPPLIIALFWVTLEILRDRASPRRPVIFAGLSLFSIGIAAVPLLIDMLRTPRALVDIGQWSVSNTLSLLVVLTNWFTEFDLGGQTAAIASISMLVLAIYGVYSAVRRGNGRGAAICALFLLEPMLMMSLLLTSNFVTQRYVLFGLPFYFLLISQALTSFTWLGDAKWTALKLVPTMLVVILFAVGAYNYTTIDREDSVPSRADFRAATRYLSANAGPEDVIVFADNYARGLTVSNFYWHGNPPTRVYDVRDPRLATHDPKGDIYWVVSRLSPEWLRSLSAPGQGWTHVEQFLDGVILREGSHGRTILESLERMAERNEAIRPDHGFTQTLLGVVYQGTGEISPSVLAYQAANGSSNPILAVEYRRTALGFEARGHNFESWREMSISKALHPASPELHRWMAKQLEEEGYTDQSRIEMLIANALEAQK